MATARILNKTIRKLVQSFFIFLVFWPLFPVVAAEAVAPRLWNLQDADIRSVVQTISELTGKNFVVDPRVQGKMTLVSSHPMSTEQMYRVFLSMLKVLHYVAIADGPITKIIPMSDNDVQSETTVVELQYANAERIAQVIQALQAAHAVQGTNYPVTVVAGPSPRSVLIRGYPAHQASMLQLIHDLDRKNAETGAITQQVVQLNYLTASKMAPLLNKLAAGYVEQEKNKMNTTSFGVLRSPLFSVEAVEDGNIIVMSGPHEMMQNLRTVITQIDKRPQEVLVQAIIVRIDETALSQLGVQWGMGNLHNQSEQGGMETLSRAFTNGLGFIHNGNFAAIVHALYSNAGTDILATPSILVLNNQKAMISDGKNIGIYNRAYAMAGSNTGDTGYANDSTVPYNTYDRKDVTLSLSVIPQIAPDNTVKLSIMQKDDSLAPDAQSKDSNNPTINTSHINTSVLVNSGDILVLGGLISHNETAVDQKIPFLSRVPLLRLLFNDTVKTQERKNLLVFIRPVIINNKQDADVHSTKSYDYIRYQQMREQNNINWMHNAMHPVLPVRSLHANSPIALPLPFSGNK